MVLQAASPHAQASITRSNVMDPATPERGDPDRKRVLNVLAQRRYRQRRRERLQSLERRVKVTSPGNNDANHELSTSSPIGTPTVTAPFMNGDVQGFHDMQNFSWNAADDAFSSPDAFSQDYPSLSADLQHLEILQFAFPDESTLELPVQQTLRAGLDIAHMLNCLPVIWDPTYRHVFDRARVRCAVLPPDLEPTAAQLTVPHHPLFDILPWPTVRTRLISLFAMPPACRPPAARDPLALMYMVYDMDDLTEGFRVGGVSGMEGSQWEVGQAFFRNWWWALDRDVVAQSNRLRAERGARPLELVPS